MQRLAESCTLADEFFQMLRAAFRLVMDSTSSAATKICDMLYGFLRKHWVTIAEIMIKFVLGSKLVDRIQEIICRLRCKAEQLIKAALQKIMGLLRKAFPGLDKPPAACGASCPIGAPCADDDDGGPKKPVVPIDDKTNCTNRCRPGNCFAADTGVHTSSGTQSIQALCIGQRVVTFLPHERRGDAPVEPTSGEWAAHRLVTITLWFEDGEFINMQLLRDPGWFRTHQPEVGSLIYLEMPEMGVQGEGIVESIEPCPPIESGQGRVITATFHHSTGECLDIHTAGRDETISATGGHPFWRSGSEFESSAGSRSASKQFELTLTTDEDGLWQLDSEVLVMDGLEREHCGLPGEWAMAHSLEPQDLLATLAGSIEITSIDEPSSSQPVFNIEVDGDHVYRVGESGVLVHNASCNWCVKRGYNYREYAPSPYKTWTAYVTAPKPGGCGEPSPANLEDPHGHHIVMKGNRFPENEKARQILCEVGINPFTGCENLVISPNKCHSKSYAIQVLKDLEKANEKGRKKKSSKANRKKAVTNALKDLARLHRNCPDGGVVSEKTDE
ncbi:MAG: hypothetical protein O3B13_24055 [Planctomycetota bacterium]|nr:hypothetical protein [Planctomycetota bacterium]